MNTKDGSVVAIFIAPVAGEKMYERRSVEAVAGLGLKGDRYATGNGSWNRGQPGKRQVTLIDAAWFEGSGFTYAESRRNIITSGVDLMSLIGKEFKVGAATFRGVKYCAPCDRPSALRRNKKSFEKTFTDRGGLIAEVIKGGLIQSNDEILPPTENS